MFASKDFFQGTTAPSTYSITKSLRFRSSASAYLNRTQGVPTSSQKATWSFWVKRGKTNGTYTPLYSGSSGSAAGGDQLAFLDSSSSLLKIFFNGGASGQVATTQLFRDFSAWYHIVVAIDTTQATAANRVIFYVNGVAVTSYSTASYPAQNYNMTQFFANTNVNRIGSDTNTVEYLDGYLAEFYGIDGQALTPSSFGAIDANGVWSPVAYSGTYGNNGFYLKFTDNSAATATTIGKDYSGNGNNWTPNNISVTAGVTYDSMIDSPTNAASATQPVGNYCTLNPVMPTSLNATVPSNGNLTLPAGTAANRENQGTIYVNSGKWYFEVTNTVASSGGGMGITTYGSDIMNSGVSGPFYVYLASSGNKNSAGPTSVAYGATWDSSTEVVGCAFDLTGGTVTFYKNNVSQGTAFTGITAGYYTPWVGINNTSGSTRSINFGQQPFTYTPPSGYQALCTSNLSTPTIPNGALYMAATTYTGTGATQTIANTVNSKSFKPDLVWTKSRSAATDHKLTDSVRGVTKAIISDSTAAQTTDANGLTAFASNGFTLGTDTTYNNNTATYVAWQWLGSNTTASNTNGSITSTVCVNTTSGFSVVTYTGTGANGTVGHGLGIAPSMIISKNTGSVSSWRIYHAYDNATPQNYALYFDTSAATLESAAWNNTAPTSSVFSVGTNNSSNTFLFVAYCFAPITGYSAFGSYTGNGSSDGPFVYCGFRPRYILTKITSGGTGDWYVFDTSRSPYNEVVVRLNPDLAVAESTDANDLDILSNGFKLRNAGADRNLSGGTFIYAAFAENPFNYSRAR